MGSVTSLSPEFPPKSPSFNISLFSQGEDLYPNEEDLDRYQLDRQFTSQNQIQITFTTITNDKHHPLSHTRINVTPDNLKQHPDFVNQPFNAQTALFYAITQPETKSIVMPHTASITLPNSPINP